MKKKSSKTKKILISICLILALIIGGVAFAINHYSSKVERVDIDRNIVTETGKTPAKEDENIITIALLGTDFSQNEKYGNLYGASDSTMILGIDKKNNKIKLFSLMRDMYLDLPDGSGKQNLNYTMAYGGPELILKTINTNFNLKVDKFISVSLHSLPTIIDKLGGVEITLTNEELNYINGYINNINSVSGTNSPIITTPGAHHVDGAQALAYSRIRYTSGGDFKRTERQRTVLTALFNKALNVPATQYLDVISTLAQYATTNLNTNEILKLATKIGSMGLNGVTIEQERFPIDGYYEGAMIDGIYYLTFDATATRTQVMNYIFNDQIPY